MHDQPPWVGFPRASAGHSCGHAPLAPQWLAEYHGVISTFTSPIQLSQSPEKNQGLWVACRDKAGPQGSYGQHCPPPHTPQMPWEFIEQHEFASFFWDPIKYVSMLKLSSFWLWELQQLKGFQPNPTLPSGDLDRSLTQAQPQIQTGGPISSGMSEKFMDPLVMLSKDWKRKITQWEQRTACASPCFWQGDFNWSHPAWSELIHWSHLKATAKHSQPSHSLSNSPSLPVTF